MSTQNGMTRPAGAFQGSLRQSRHYSAAHPGGSPLSMAAAAAARTAVGRTLTGLGVMLALGSFVIVPPICAQEEPPSRPVTGSRIVSEREFAAPVYVLDRAAIDAAGVAILGDLLLQIPMIAGAALNPQVNNGGGNGATHVDLRGLGSRKTLLLLNGRRVIASGTFSRDVNAIPISLIERVEVLMEGASVTYGSGAPGGVVNVITRRDHQGLEAVTSYGRSERNDGERTYHSLTMGNVGPDRGLLIGLNFDRRARRSVLQTGRSRLPTSVWSSGNVSSLVPLRLPRGCSASGERVRKLRGSAVPARRPALHCEGSMAPTVPASTPRTGVASISALMVISTTSSRTTWY